MFYQILGYLRRANTVFKSTEEDHRKLFSAGSKIINNSVLTDGLHLHFLKARNAWFVKALENAQANECKCNNDLFYGSMYILSKIFH